MTVTGITGIHELATRHAGLWIRGRLVAAILVAVAGSVILHPRATLDLFVTPDQRAQLLMTHGQARAAADLFSDPQRQGVALYRAGDFKDAAVAFSRDPSPTGQFDQANALVMHGQYGEAIKLYDALLAARPGWQAAKDNRGIAAIRAARLQTTGGEADTGETPDAVVYDTSKSHAQQPDQPAADSTQQAASDAALRETWLRRVATKPADFLRAKFAFQFSQQLNALPPATPSGQTGEPAATEPKP